MKSKVITGIAFTLLLIGVSTLAFNIQPVKSETTTLLASIDGSMDQWSSGSYSTVVLSFVMSTYPPSIFLLIGDELNHSDGDTGSWNFDASNEPEFNGVVTYLTNNQNDYIEVRSFLDGGAAAGSTEANWIGGNPDLAGFHVNFIRLVIHSLSIYPEGAGTRCIHNSTWEIWGTERLSVVGGVSIPVNKLQLLAPYIGLTILLAVAVITVVYVKKRKRKSEINS